MRSCYVVLRNMSRYLQQSTTMGEKIMYICMCNWVPMLYSGAKRVLGEIRIKKCFKKRQSLCRERKQVEVLGSARERATEI